MVLNNYDARVVLIKFSFSLGSKVFKSRSLFPNDSEQNFSNTNNFVENKQIKR